MSDFKCTYIQGNECMKWGPKCGVLRDLPHASRFRSNARFIVAKCNIYERRYLSLPDKRSLTSVASWGPCSPGSARERDPGPVSSARNSRAAGRTGWIKIALNSAPQSSRSNADETRAHIYVPRICFFFGGENIRKRNPWTVNYTVENYLCLMLFRYEHESDRAIRQREVSFAIGNGNLIGIQPVIKPRQREARYNIIRI